jgi:RNA polymerase sigma factor (sigma-70 family)
METTRTTTKLLQGLTDPACGWAWAEFDARYRPLLHAVSRSAGLDDADAADVAQDTIAVFIAKYSRGEYDRARARVRSWLCGIARMKIIELQRQRARQRRMFSELDDDALAPDEQTMTRVWEQAQRSLLLAHALEQLRTNSRFNAKTVDAFELYVLRGCTPESVAETLGMSVNDVYVAKHRVLDRLRVILQALERERDDER